MPTLNHAPRFLSAILITLTLNLTLLFPLIPTAQSAPSTPQSLIPKLHQLKNNPLLVPTPNNPSFFQDFTQLLGSSNSFDIALADLDIDGDLDAFVANTDYNTVWLNTGAGEFINTAQELGANTSYAVALGDLDGDGDFDAFIANYDNGPNTVWLNDGAATFTDSAQSLGSASSTHVALGDLDGDGDFDAFVTNATTGNTVWLNNGDATFTDSAQSLGSASSQHVTLADLDGDTDLDAFVANSNNEPNQIWLNDGAANFSAGNSYGAEDSYAIALNDFNQDSFIDAFIVNNNASDEVWLNDGAGNFTQLPQTLDTSTGRDVIIADFEGDGDFDAFVVNNNTNPNTVWLNQGDGTFASNGQALGQTDSQAVAFGDLNGDGALDAFVANSTQQPNHVWFNNGGSLLLSDGQVLGNASSQDLALGDLNNDSYPDVVFANINNLPNSIWLNTNTGILTYTNQVLDNASSYGVALADLDADHDLDIFFANNHNTPNIVWLNDGAGTFTDSGQTLGSASSHDVQLGDLDGDNDIDAFVANTDSQPNTVWFNDGSGTFTDSGQTLNNNSTQAVALGDLDNDGDLDAITANIVGEDSYVWLNDGDGFFTQFGDAFSNESWFDIDLGDLDGDGDLDLFVSNYYGQPNQVWFNDGQANFTLDTQTFVENYTLGAAIADLNGDTYLDVYVTNLDGTLILYNDGAGQLEPSPDTSNNLYGYQPALGDLDLDGDIDIVIANGFSTTNAVYVNRRGDLKPFELFITHPISTAAANFFATPLIIDNQYIDIPYTLSSELGQPIPQIQAFYSLNGGGQWLPAEPTTSTQVVDIPTEPNILFFEDFEATGTDTYFNNTSSLNGAPQISYSNTNNGNGRLRTLAGPGFPFSGIKAATLDRRNPGPGVTNYLILSLDLSAYNPLTDTVTLSFAYMHHGQETHPNDNVWIRDNTATSPTWLPLFNLDTITVPAGQYVQAENIDISQILLDNGQTFSSDIQIRWGQTGSDQAINLTGIDGLTIDDIGIYHQPRHIFTWDTFASGLFGQGDNVTFRLVAYMQPQADITGTYHYTNSVPYPTPWPQTDASSFPIRVRGTQVQVVSGTISSSTPVTNALVYQLPSGQETGATTIANEASDQPFVTDSQGYLQGFGHISTGDQLVALLPITTTDSYTLYYTSAAPTTTGLDMHTVTDAGVQTLYVNANKPLYLFNLDVSLEWDATLDDMITDLSTAIQYGSEVLYDTTNGQMALGDINIYHNRENWHNADIIIYAANDIHPSASMGGVVTTPTHDIGLTGVITNAYRPGLVRMGTNWDPYGESQSDLTEDWWNALAHELGHYLLYMPDNYIGIDDNGLLATDCYGSFMTTSYDDAYTEFLPSADWTGDCLNTIANKTTGRPDWDTITTFYPLLNAPASKDENSGPSFLPLNVTTINDIPPSTTNTNLETVTNYTLRNASTSQILTLPNAQGYLRQTQNNDDLTDDALIPLGISNAGGDRLKVRGASIGDELCLVDTSDLPSYVGCQTINGLNTSLNVNTFANWQPNILVTSITSQTLAVTVTQYITSGQLNIQIIPAYGLPGTDNIITTTTAALTVMDSSNTTFTGQIDLDYLIFEGTARIWVPDSTPSRQAFADFSISLDAWGGESAIWGGESAIWSGESAIWSGESAIWGGESAIWGGPSRSWGAPAVSSDGQLIILNLDDPYGPTGISSMQSINSLSTLPAWHTLVGQAYNIQIRDDFTRTVTRTIAIDYLQRQTPDGFESTLTIYHSPDYGNTWNRLDTTLDTDENRATTLMDATNPEGIYALIATVKMSPFNTGWNLFGYPIMETRAVTTALASIDGYYNTVYHYDAYAAEWLLYDAPLAKDYPAYTNLVNTLDNLEFGLGYWLYATQPITLFLGVPENSSFAPTTNLFTFPPATYFGPVTASSNFTPTAGMSIDAYINDTLCGTSTLTALNSDLVYTLQAKADASDNCGTTGATITFAIDNQTIITSTTSWDSSQAQYHPITADICTAPATPTLTTTPTSLDIILTWSDAAADQYEVWHHTTPYTNSGTDCAAASNCTLTTTLTYTDNNAITTDTLNIYQLIATNSCGLQAPTTETGTFTYDLTPGT
ncbi:MAG TPA: VCBS repeat-containing protein [Anaerolineae bacterium]|nr:VCBS repeat-containing protein [Anaerolineae bacterium]